VRLGVRGACENAAVLARRSLFASLSALFVCACGAPSSQDDSSAPSDVLSEAALDARSPDGGALDATAPTDDVPLDVARDTADVTDVSAADAGATDAAPLAGPRRLFARSVSERAGADSALDHQQRARARLVGDVHRVGGARVPVASDRAVSAGCAGQGVSRRRGRARRARDDGDRGGRRAHRGLDAGGRRRAGVRAGRAVGRLR
jgi:hypothetical protein